MLLPKLDEIGLWQELVYGDNNGKKELNPKVLATKVVLDIIILRSFMPELEHTGTSTSRLTSEEINVHVFVLLNLTVLEIKEAVGPMRLNIDTFQRFFQRLLSHPDTPWDKPMVHDKPGMLERYRELFNLVM